MRIALSAPIARAFLKTVSLDCSPTFITSIDALFFSLNHIALVNPNSSFGLMTNCTPLVSKSVSLLVKLILEVVSGTQLIQTKIFMQYKYSTIYYARIVFF